jgi:hypothetical protein
MSLCRQFSHLLNIFKTPHQSTYLDMFEMTYKYFLWILLCVDCGQTVCLSALFFYHCTHLLFCPVCPTLILYYGISNNHHKLAKCSVRKFLVKLITAFIIGWIFSIWFVKKRNMLFISVYHLVNVRWLWWKAEFIVVTWVWDSWRRSQHFFLCGIGLGCHAFTFTYAAS